MKAASVRSKSSHAVRVLARDVNEDRWRKLPPPPCVRVCTAHKHFSLLKREYIPTTAATTIVRATFYV
jgi:hypothetical protein